MHAVTTDARCNSRFAFFFQELAVHARVILFLLIHSQRRIESLHQIRVAVALAAVRRNIERLWFAEIALARILRGFFGVGIGIPTMAIVAGQTARFMNVVIEQFRGRAQARVVKFDVAFNAGAFLLSGSHGGKDKNEGERQQFGVRQQRRRFGSILIPCCSHLSYPKRRRR